MYYERKIKYLDYLVKQEKCGNAGFIKLEVRGEICSIAINVNNLRQEDSGPVRVYLIGDGCEKELCMLDLMRGKGLKQLQGQAVDNLGRTGIAYAQLEAIRIAVSADRELYTVIGQAFHAKEVQAAAEEEQATEAEDNTPVCETEENVPEQETFSETVREPDEKEEMGEKKLEEIRVPLHDDKWKQLWAIYPHIAPFRDEREYLAIGPNDFVILPGKYFRMANNSFLLHGYYNYKHLVLKKMEYHGETRFYIGVPGNFYEREKQVAVMFGFESFESLEESAQIGDYGYYLMRIEL